MDELSKQIADYVSLKRTLRDLEDKLDAVEGEIKAYMGDQEELVVDGYTVRWKRIRQSRFDTTAFRSRHTALYEQFLTHSVIRRFTVTQ